MKSKKLLDEFVAYCEAHPHERFWQALRNWCGWQFVLVTQKVDGRDEIKTVDTFYWEENKKP